MPETFRSIPSFADLLARMETLTEEFRALQLAIGHHIGGLEANLQDNNNVTDTAIEELTLKVAFLMSIIRAKRPLNAGLADVTGQVQFEQITALELYQKGGRQQLLDQRNATTKALMERDAADRRAREATTDATADADDPAPAPPTTRTH